MIEYKGFRVEVRTVRNARHIRLRHLGAEDYFRMSVPPGTTDSQVKAFLEASRDWMQKHMNVAPSLNWQCTYAPGERHWVLGRLETLGQNGVPCGEKAFLEYRYRRLYELVLKLLPYWQQRMGVAPSMIRWRNMTTQWGNCQKATGVIKLSLRLAAVPPELVQSVLVHEMCHLVHANHSPAFYALMAGYLPDWKTLKTRLNSFDARPLPPEQA